MGVGGGLIRGWGGGGGVAWFGVGGMYTKNKRH